MTDNVNHPQHYEKHKIVLEPIDIIEDLPFALGNVFKYIIRAEDKGNELEDLKKARWYFHRADECEAFRVFDYLQRLTIFRYCDNPTLCDFALRIVTGATDDFIDPWTWLSHRLDERICDLEGAR